MIDKYIILGAKEKLLAYAWDKLGATHNDIEGAIGEKRLKFTQRDKDGNLNLTHVYIGYLLIGVEKLSIFEIFYDDIFNKKVIGDVKKCMYIDNYKVYIRRINRVKAKRELQNKGKMCYTVSSTERIK